MSQYHDISENTMDTLLESLEAFLDSKGEDTWEVEYSVGYLTTTLIEAFSGLTRDAWPLTERSADVEPRLAWHLRYK
jgi:hypothetical protein